MVCQWLQGTCEILLWKASMLKLWEVTTNAVTYDLSTVPCLHISIQLSVLHPEATRVSTKTTRLLCFHRLSSFLAICFCECPENRELPGRIAREIVFLCWLSVAESLKEDLVFLVLENKRALSWPSRSRSVVYLGLEPALLAGSQLHPLSIGILLKCDFLNKN